MIDRRIESPEDWPRIRTDWRDGSAAAKFGSNDAAKVETTKP